MKVLRLAALATLALIMAAAAQASQEVDLGVITVKDAKLAEALRNQLAGGAPFEDLARRYSVSPTANRGGRLGQVSLGRLRPEYRAALKDLAPNKPSQVVPTEEGYTILMRFEPAPTPATRPDTAFRLDKPAMPAPSAPPASGPEEERYLKARRQILAGLESMVAGDMAGSEKKFSQAMGLNPHEASTPFLLEVARRVQSGAYKKEAGVAFAEGFLSMTQGQPAGALQGFTKAGKLDPRLWQAKLFQGNLLAGQGKRQEAKKLWQEVIEARPDAALAYVSLGIMARDEGELQEAQRLLQEALKINPDLAEAHYVLGGIALFNGDFAEAERRYKTTLVLDPFNEEAHNDLGLSRLYQGRKEDAEAAYLKALEINPNFAAAHVNLGNLRAQEGRLNQAVDEFTKALNLDPSLADAHNNLAAAFILLGQWDKAIEHVDAALGMNYPVPQVILDKVAPHRKSQPSEKQGG